MGKKPNKKELSQIFNIPYPTICDWSKADKDNWRFLIVDFLQKLDKDEIELIIKRGKKIS